MADPTDPQTDQTGAVPDNTVPDSTGPDSTEQASTPSVRDGSSAPAVPTTDPTGGRPEPSAIGGFLAPVAGFGVTFATMFRKVATQEYPEVKRPTAKRFHGRHQLNRYEDGLEKCIGCELCAWACPADAIYVEAADNIDGARFSPGDRYGRVYQINYLRCIFCGLCIEACPTRALTMTNEYELADDNRTSLIYEKHQLLSPLAGDQLPPPFPMAQGMTDRDYYRGKVTGPTQAQKDYVQARDDGADEAAAGTSDATDRTTETEVSR